MASHSLSVNEFKKQLEGDVRDICSANNWTYDTSSHRGWAFQIWIARLFAERDRGIETSPDEGVFHTADGGIDIILEGTNERVLYFIQTKYHGLSKTSPIARQDVTDFFGAHSRMLDPNTFETAFPPSVRDHIGNYKSNLTNGFRAHFYFVSTGRDTDGKCHKLASAQSATFEKQDGVAFHVLDFNGLKDFFVETKRLEDSIPDSVSLDLGSGRWIYMEEPRPTLVCVIKANQLKNLYQKEGDALFAHNIRTFLGRKSLNKGIIDTVSKAPSDFFYFNNGISGICTDLTIEETSKKVTALASKFQIINGAQTVGSLAKSPTTADCYVLLRVTEGESVSTEKGFNANIIKYNNTQNLVKASDFRSNDPIQQWLEDRFRKQLTSGNAIPNIKYQRKRSGKRVPSGSVPLSLEDLAKIRYAWLYEPTRCIADPKSLWTHHDEGGVYEQAFGVDGTLYDNWSDDTFKRTLVAVVFYTGIESKIGHARKKDQGYIYLRRLRYFALGLAPIYLRRKGLDGMAMINGPIKDYRRHFEDFWKGALRELVSAYQDFVVGEEKGTLFALARSEKRWRNLKTKYDAIIHLTEA